jgi:excisionase family DNA binding protein
MTANIAPLGAICPGVLYFSRNRVIQEEIRNCYFCCLSWFIKPLTDLLKYVNFSVVVIPVKERYIMIVAQDKDLSVDEAARRLGVHPNTVRSAIERGQIRARKVLGRWRIRESEVQRILRGDQDEEEREDEEQ